MTQYLLSVWGTEGDPTPDEETMQRMYAATDVVNDEMKAAGAWVFAGGMEPRGTATMVAVDGTTTDGPFAETKEFVGGFWIIEADDLDAALTWARKGAAACGGPVEVRPFQAG